MGTSTCDMMVETLEKELPDIPGLCGIVPESILPGYYGLEAGQSAVGDIFNWFVNVVQPAGLRARGIDRQAARLKPGESGLLALDWHNGNRTVLVDQRLTGGSHRPDAADDPRRTVPRLGGSHRLRRARHHGAL